MSRRVSREVEALRLTQAWSEVEGRDRKPALELRGHAVSGAGRRLPASCRTYRAPPNHRSEGEGEGHGGEAPHTRHCYLKVSAVRP